MRPRLNHQVGSVLVTTLVITALVTIAIAALLTVVNRQHYYTARSSTWCSEIPVAEAGIEEAMAHLNSRPRGKLVFATNGWTLLSNNVVRARYFTNTGAAVPESYFYTAISTTRPP